MDTSYSYQGSLHLLNDSEWNKLSVQDRAAVLQSVENEVARREDRPPCNISLFSEAPKNGTISAGRYNPLSENITLNTYYLTENPTDCLNTVLHEGRHGYQDKAVKGEINHYNQAELNAWRNNMKPGHYINPEKNRRAYYRQPVETDAREYADITTRQIQAEQKIQNRGIAFFQARTSSPQSQAASENKGIEAFHQRVSGKLAGTNTSQSTNQGIKSYQKKPNEQTVCNKRYSANKGQSNTNGQER
jgi:hypothetical protein